MLSGRTVGVDSIIEELQRDYGFDDVDKSEVVEWIWKSMGIIGTPYPFEDKPKEIDIVEYRAILPVDLYSINMIREKTTGITLREMTDQFNEFGDAAYEGVTEIIADYDPASDTGAYYETIVGADSSSEYYTYKVRGNYIYAGMEECTLEMSYKAIPIDIVTGMPTIPDNVRYIRGVVSFIAERMAFRLMLRDLISERKYDRILQDYCFNIGGAKAECIMPDVSRMETMLNRWKSTYLGPSHFDTGMKYLGSRE
jgi:hypothetical protein